MGMVVRTNTMALNAYRQLGMNNSAVSKSLEKLSSGFRINRAGDDASGLAISEKMKAQIAGLETASSNAQDGISLIQTAEGALTEVHSMLNRMVELATKSANGTYQDDVDREAIQAEVDALLTEIDRIGNGTNFNGINLLDGTMGMSDAITIGASTKADKGGAKTGDAIGVTATHSNTGEGATEAKPVFTVDLADFTITQKNDGAAVGEAEIAMKIGGQTVTFVKDAEAATNANTATTLSVKAADKDTDMEKTGADIVTDAKIGDATNGYKHAIIGSEVYELTGNGSKITFTWKGKVGSDNKLNEDAKVDDATVNVNPKGKLELTATKKAGGNDIATKNRDNCHITTITDAVKESTIDRAGASLKLTAAMVKSGNTLKIGEDTFTFTDQKTAAEAGANEIGLKDLKNATEAELLRDVTEQFSNKGTVDIKDKDGGTHSFTIGRGDGLDTIEIEEDVSADLSTSPYGNFTAAQMKAAFTLTTSASNATQKITLSDNPAKNSAITIGGTTYTFREDDGDTEMGTNDVAIGATASDTAKNLADKLKVTYTGTTQDGTTVTIVANGAKDAAPTISGGGLNLQIGDTGAAYNMMSVAVDDMRAQALGLKDLDVSTADAARSAIDTIKAAINKVSTNRANMGALQNRLEYTINNLDVAVENMSAANSRIRDTDMAKEMMNYTKMNVLVQSAQAMLAQANQQPQSVLQLLQ